MNCFIQYVVILVLLSGGSAQAGLMLLIERVSDTRAIVSGSGTLENGPLGGNPQLLSLENPFASAIPPFDNEDVFAGSTMRFGRFSIDQANNVGGSFNFFESGAPGIYFGTLSRQILEDPISGLLQLELPAGMSFGSVGTVGNVFWGISGPYNNPPPGGMPTGTWEVVDATTDWIETPQQPTVPEPTSIALWSICAVGIGLVAACRRRAKQTTIA